MASFTRVVFALVSIASSSVAFGAAGEDACACTHARAPQSGLIWSNGTAPGPRSADARYMSEAARFGAAGSEDARVRVQVGFRMVSFSPWCPVGGGNIRRFEQARQQWLKDQGYVGAVRTFVRDELASDVEKKSVQGIKPRAIIEIAPDVPRLRSRPEVRVVPSDRVMQRSAKVRVKVANPTTQASVQ